MIRQITMSKEETKSDNRFELLFRKILGDEIYESYKERTNGESYVHAPEDVNTPLYRNGAGYKAIIDGEIIKKLTVHYYYTDY